MCKTIIILTLLLTAVAVWAEVNSPTNLKQESNLTKEFWLAGGLGFGSSHSGGNDAQFGYYMQGILKDKSMTYSAHYQGFTKLDIDIMPGWGSYRINREIKQGHILGLQAGFIPVEKYLGKTESGFKYYQTYFKLGFAAGVSCNMLSQGTYYIHAYPEDDGWHGPYHWTTAIGFPLSLDLMITTQKGGIKLMTYYNYNKVAPLFLIEVGYIGRLSKSK